MPVQISPSIMCAHVEEFYDYCKLAEKVGCPFIHFDIMDGHYVKNSALGTQQYADIKRITNLPIDIHLMVTNPEEYIEMFNVQPGDRVAFHPETSQHAFRLLQTLHSKGITAGLAVIPGMSLHYIEELLVETDFILDMTINPGFGGQKIVPGGMDKIRRMRQFLDEHSDRHIPILIDGNTVIENAKQMYINGADVLIVGPSTLMKGPDRFEELYYAYKAEIDAVKND